MQRQRLARLIVWLLGVTLTVVSPHTLILAATQHEQCATALAIPVHEHISTGSFKLNPDGTIQNHLTADQRGRLSNYADGAGRLAISPDGRTVLTSDATYRGGLWDLQSGTLLHLLQGHACFVESVAFSPDG